MCQNNRINIGHQKIDDHHAKIFDLAHQLETVIKSQNKSTLNDIILFLEEYSLDHFIEEEALMKEHRFSDYKIHKEEHELLFQKIKNLRNMFNSNCPLSLCIYYVRKFTDQMIYHITTVDIKLKPLVKKTLNIKKNQTNE